MLHTMTAQNMLIAADGHLHWYPFYRLKSAFGFILHNLDAMARGKNPSSLPVLNMGFLAEGAGFNFFDQLSSGAIDLGPLDVDLRATADGRAVSFLQGEACRLCLIAGRQVVTRERLEVLGLGISRRQDDGKPARDVINEVLEYGGFPILTWSPGKWMFKRGAQVKEIIRHFSSSQLAIGDSSLRPRRLPEPGLMRLAREMGLAIVPGSDALPLVGEEREMGSYGFLHECMFDMDDPVPFALDMLKGDPARIRPCGARNSLLRSFMRQARLRMA